MTARREWTRNTAGLLARATSKAIDARRRAELAIQELVVEQRPVSFSAVAERAGLSKTYLYNDADLRKRIEALPASGAYAQLSSARHDSRQTPASRWSSPPRISSLRSSESASSNSSVNWRWLVVNSTPPVRSSVLQSCDSAEHDFPASGAFVAYMTTTYSEFGSPRTAR